MKPDSVGPRWETAVLLLSFLFLWVWLIAYFVAGRAGHVLSHWWVIPQLAATGVLAFVFIRRTARTTKSLKENLAPPRGRPGE